MLVYSKENYSSFNEFKQNLINELKQAFRGSKVSKDNKDAYFVDFAFSVSNLGENLNATLDFDGELRTFAIILAINSGVIKLDENIKDDFNSYVNILNKSLEVRKAEIDEETRIANEKAEALKRKYAAEAAIREEHRKQKEAEEKYNKKVQKALIKLSLTRPENTSKLFDAPQTQYEILGWMAKHLTSIRAAMPDYMESWFVSKFGDADRTVVDSKKRTTGGHPMQWGLSLKLTFDEKVKGPLELRATSQNKKTIDNVAFVWDLIENYGFQFGKEQNISQIKAEIPEPNLVDFEKGYAM